MEFNSSITQVAAKAMEHLTDFLFITMGNLALACRDSYLTSHQPRYQSTSGLIGLDNEKDAMTSR